VAGTLTALTMAGAAATAPDARAQAPAPIAIGAPVDRSTVPAVRVDRRRLAAGVELSGTAQPGGMLLIRGGCGKVECEGLTYVDRSGAWRTRVDLTTPRGRTAVTVRVSYWPASPSGPSARTRVRLARTAPIAAPAPLGLAVIGDGVRRPILLIGDSLAMGTAGALIGRLPDFAVEIDAAVGRSLWEGMGLLDQARISGDTVLAFSLFTNNDPADVAGLELAVRASVARLGPHGCAIWATISRPAQHTVTYRAANARLIALAGDPLLAGRLLVVPWAEEVTRHHGWKARDHVHATAAGYAARAGLYANAARACTA
jgi:hypothetical protein